MAQDSSRRSDLELSDILAGEVMLGTELLWVLWPQGCLPEGLLTLSVLALTPSPVSLDLSQRRCLREA